MQQHNQLHMITIHNYAQNHATVSSSSVFLGSVGNYEDFLQAYACFV